MKRREIRALTGVRAVAAWWVVIYHVRGLLPQIFPRIAGLIHSIADSGYLGVDLFFVLSGFVIAYNYWERFAEFDSYELRRFLWMRLARIYPVHFVALCLTGVLFLLVRWRHVSIASDLSGWTCATFIQNLLLVHHWMPSAQLSWNAPAWSISCEWLAYIAFPALVALLRTNHLGRLHLLVFGLLAVQCATVQAHCGNDLIRISTEFTAGVALWKIYRAGVPNRFVMVFAGIVCLASLGGHFLGYYADVWLILAFPFFVYGLTRKGFVSRLLSGRWPLYWGRASYSLYMFHAVVGMLLNKVLPLSRVVGAPFDQRVVTVAVWVAAFGGIASFCYAFIEVPARCRMQMMLDKPKTLLFSLESDPVPSGNCG
jgi:peptidoglycan/LPS O-acetylase OafA/YrhL